MVISPAVWYGVAGGVLAPLLSVLQWARTPKQERPEAPSKDAAFWVQVPILILLGGFAVFIYERSDITFKPILALHVGASAPILLQQLIATVAPVGKTG